MVKPTKLSSLTPFRYPGAKNKLLADLMPHIDVMLSGHNKFSDAFVGGGSVLLAVAKKYSNIKLYANDKDYSIYCFWSVVANSDRSQLDRLLSLIETKPTVELFNRLRAETSQGQVDSAYRAIFFNRCCFSGILSSGCIGGQKQSSKWTIDCRYNAVKLRAKIEACHQLLKGRTQVENKSITEYPYLIDINSPIYLDPPYYVKGDMLYPTKMADHDKMASILKSRANWVLSYDDCPEIRSFYQDQRIIDVDARYCINGTKSDWKKTNELIILPTGE